MIYEVQIKFRSNKYSTYMYIYAIRRALLLAFEINDVYFIFIDVDALLGI